MSESVGLVGLTLATFQTMEKVTASLDHYALLEAMTAVDLKRGI